MKKIESKDEIVKNATIGIIGKLMPLLYTISIMERNLQKHRDNSKALEIEYYFQTPYCSWERGKQNLNGLVRYLPKVHSAG
jgi:IS30 family transposase